MKMKVKHIIRKIFICMCILIVLVSSTFCGKLKKRDTDKLFIVTTLFPQYDFAKQIVGDKGEVKLLLSPGLEAHSFDPAPSDIVDINESDLFIYTGNEMETWVPGIIKGMESDVNVLDVSKGIDLVKEEDEEKDNINHGYEEHQHDHIYDPHIWTSPVNAMIMIENIVDGLVEIDSENADYYRKNADEYLRQLTELDKDIWDVVANSQIKTIFFADKFAMYYFIKEYGLSYISAYDSCSAETEPSAKLVANMVDEVKECGATVVFYAELSNHKAADTISEETGAQSLLLHSCHNVSKKEFDSGVTYLSIMRHNLENLKISLQYNS